MKEKPFGMRNILIRGLCAAYIAAAGFSPLFADKRAADRDWVDRRIDNAIADELIIDRSAFSTDTQTEKKIDVIDPNENPLGSWIFD